MATYAFKGLNGLSSRHGFPVQGSNFCWPEPKNEEPGDWVELTKRPDRALRPHFWGFHGSNFASTVSWLHQRNFIMEAGGDIVASEEIVVCSKARLVKELTLPSWSAARLCLGFIRDVIDFPSNAEFAPDQVRLLSDTYQNLRMRLGWSHEGDEPPKSSFSYCFHNMPRLIERLDNDRKTAVELSNYSNAFLQIARAICKATAFATGIDVPTWKLIHEISFLCRQALQSAASQHHHATYPVPLSQTLPRLAKVSKDCIVSEVVANLYKSQSERLNSEWGLFPSHNLARLIDCKIGVPRGSAALVLS